ncbi:DUF7660 family protein [Pseudomonas brassicacearum]|uniref:DUF7660 family protein n=1 Tax=Pseudomonas brassicacearum TaxID=930166 RepID=UPI002733C547|nr:hypothetical protein [Pseudomonas brassicacearum]WLG70619.1 hypothetical protein PSH71_12660 [Pseudomonas brassicacearum]
MSYVSAQRLFQQEGFVDFVEMLSRDYVSNRDEWQNDTLEQFLLGLSGFANDMGGYYKNMGEAVDVDKITWRIAAEMLIAATVYE